MAGSALKRLMAEYKRKYVSEVVFLSSLKHFLLTELTLNPPEGIVAGKVMVTK